MDLGTGVASAWSAGISLYAVIAFPEVAFVVTLVLAVGTTLTAVILFTASRAAWRRLRARSVRPADP